MKKFLLSFLLMLQCCVVLAQPLFSGEPAMGPVPTDEPGFLTFIARRLQQLLPYHEFQVSGHSVWGQRKDGEALGQLDPLPTYRFCVQDAVRCPDAVDQYTRTVVELARVRSQPVTAGQVRLALRNQAFVDEVRHRATADGAGAPLFVRPFVPGIVVVPVLDFLGSVRYVGTFELNRLKLTEEQLFDVGRSNLQTSMLPMQAVARRPATGHYGSIEAEDHAASRVLLHSDWAELAAQFNHQLAVLLPTPNIVLYGDAANPVQIEVMRRTALDMYKRSLRPLSLQLLRWTPSGWTLMNAGDESASPSAQPK